MVDTDGRDAILVVDYRIRYGLPIVGHAFLYFQDSDGNWHKTEFSGKKPKDASIKLYSADGMGQLLNMLEGKKLSLIDYVYIEGDFSKSYDAASSYAGTNYGGYRLRKNNCADYVYEILMKATLDNAELETALGDIEPMVPSHLLKFIKSKQKTKGS